ncbi:hypothetical protein BA723_01170 [Helicobacter sp. CLO-3]|nr:hypothetical protein BA723_01170 [Helicobacter sp. CLO-3]
MSLCVAFARLLCWCDIWRYYVFITYFFALCDFKYFDLAIFYILHKTHCIENMFYFALQKISLNFYHSLAHLNFF